jgi:cytochrome P450
VAGLHEDSHRRDIEALPAGLDYHPRGRERRQNREVPSPYITHYRTDLWENPEGFDPERFAPGNGYERPRYAYYPRGGGQHMCIGNSLALIEAALIMSTVTQR